MKYMLMIQGTQGDYDAMTGTSAPGAPAWTKEDLQAMVGFMRKLNEDLGASGELVDGQGLTAPSDGGLVTADEDGRPVVSKNGYGVEQPVIVGYWVLECRDFDRAAEIAARIHQCPVPEGSTNPPVIVRPIGEEPPVD
ncbi:YciI family protein [Streptomyces ovatisporus]|uniref:YciI family protein n=1 Tax=Streptomyces ovatisporus TaxID=1128682 RepID=A0ABV9AA34_9ACTN